MKNAQTVVHPVVTWLHRLLPASLTIPPREQWRIVAGTALGILLTDVAQMVKRMSGNSCSEFVWQFCLAAHRQQQGC